MNRSDLTETVAAATVTVGVFVEFGPGWALIVSGLTLLVGAQLRGVAAALVRRPRLEDTP